MVFLEILVVVLSILLLIFLYKNFEWKLKFEQRVKEHLASEEKRIREDAILRSARTLSGKTLEKLIPFLDKFPYNSHDIRWLGDPIDYVIFDGYSSEGQPKQIVFCEIKSGDGKLTKTQNIIKELVENKKVRWYEFRI